MYFSRRNEQWAILLSFPIKCSVANCNVASPVISYVYPKIKVPAGFFHLLSGFAILSRNLFFIAVAILFCLPIRKWRTFPSSICYSTWISDFSSSKFVLASILIRDCHHKIYFITFYAHYRTYAWIVQSVRVSRYFMEFRPANLRDFC